MKLKATPWGIAQSVETHEHSITRVSTASHGGFFVPQPQLAEMPEPYRLLGEPGIWESETGRWYEEDCAWAAVIASFPNMKTARSDARTNDGVTVYRLALRTLRGWYPAAYEEATGETVPDEENQRKAWDEKCRRWKEEHAG